MEQVIAPEKIAEELSGKSNGGVRFVGEQDRGRLKFKYSGVVQSHRIPDEYEIVGFGSSWFVLRLK